MNNHMIEKWHALVASGDPAGLDALLADEVVFHSPVLHTPQRGKEITSLYLGAAFQVLFNGAFKYTREIVGESDAMLEFETVIDGVTINGVDIIHWNAENRITDFKVLVRPMKAMLTLKDKMAQMLETLNNAS